MNFARMHKWVTYVFATAGLYALTLGGELTAPFQALMWVALVGSWFAEGAYLRSDVYVKRWTWVVIGAFVLQVLRSFFLGEPFLALGVEYAAFLQLSRLFNRRGAADHQQIAVLALLHLIAATILTTEIGYAVVFLAFVVVTPWMLTVSHLRREIEDHYQAEKGGEERVNQLLRSQRIIGGRFLAATGLLSVPIFLITALLFLLFPRVGMGFLSFSRDKGQQVAGFGDDVELGGFGVIRDDPTVVLRITPNDLPPNPAPQMSFRMRGTSFDSYDGRRWTRAAVESSPLRMQHGYYPLRRHPSPGRDSVVAISLEPIDENVVFVPEGAVALRVPPRMRAGLPRARVLKRAPDGELRYADADGLGLQYEVFVEREPSPNTVLTHVEQAHYLGVAGERSRITELARRVAGEGTPELQAKRVEAYLSASGEFAYSLEQPRVGDRDPLEVFLFEAKSGHCEYFSTAMAIMLRTIGIPTRNVTGFVGGRYNSYGGYYALSQGDAHSWVEAYVDGRWQTFDPTPASWGQEGPSDGFFAEVRAMMDALRSRWDNDIVDYDLRSQMSAFRAILTWARGFRGTLQGGAEQSDDAKKETEVPRMRLNPWYLGAFVLTVVLVALWRQRLRTRRSRAKDPMAYVFGRYERALSRVGLTREAGETPREHLARLVALGFPAAEQAAFIVELHAQVRYGGRVLAAEEVQQAKAAVTDVETASRTGRFSVPDASDEKRAA